MKKAISLFLVLSMLLGAFMLVGCPNNGPTVDPNKPNNGGEGNGEWADNLDTEAIKKELGGDEATMTISAFERYDYEIYAEESSKDSLDQLIYKRNKKVEERFNIKIVPDITPLLGENDMSSHIDYVTNEISTMQPTFDLIAMMAYQSGKLITGNGGSYRDWRSGIPYARDSITAGDKWWPSEMNKNSTVNGRQFVAISDMSITLIDLSFAILFNKTLTDSYNVPAEYGASLPSPKNYTSMYEIVNDGAWTLDALITMTKDRWYDNATAGTRNEADKEDIFGIVISPATELDNFAWSSGFSYVKNDGVSNPEVWTLPATFDSMVGNLRNWLSVSKGAMTTVPLGVSYSDRDKMFAEGHIMFITGTLSILKESVIKSMENDYGVLPYPKLTAAQADYLTGAQDNITVLSVSRYTTGKALRRAGALAVALSAETNKSVNQPYYEMIVKHDSGFVDKEAVAMVDKIMNSRVYDLSIYHYTDLQFDAESTNATLGLTLRYLMVTNTTQSPSGLWDSAGSVVENRMKALINKYASLK